MSGGDPTPATLQRSAANEFEQSWLSPGVQKYLGGAFGGAAAAAQDGAPASPRPDAPAQDAQPRLQRTLASMQYKVGQASGGADGRIGAYPAAHGPTTADSTGDALAADFRSQLQRYAQQLAAKDAEVAAMRQAATALKQQAAAAEGRATHADDRLARSAAAVEQLEAANAALEQQLAEREAEVAQAAQARRVAEQAAAAAKAQAAAAQKAAGGRAAESEAERRYFQEQLQRRDEELHSLEEALRKQAAEVAQRARQWAAREAELTGAHTRTHGASAAVQAELAVAQEALEAAGKRARTLEADNAELRKQRAAAVADLRMLEELLADGDAERRELHDKYVRLGERMEALVKEGKVLKGAASAETGAARSAVQEALKDAEAAVKERAALAGRVRDLQGRLEEEAAGRSALKEKVQRKLAAAEHEVAALRGELESKARQLQGLQGDMKSLQAEAEAKLGACEKQDRAAALKQELENEKQRNAKAKDAAEAMYAERLQVELQSQALKYERRIQELEVQGGGGSGAALGLSGLRPGSSVLDYIPRAEHLRLLEVRLAAKESETQLQLNTRVAQVEREWQWKLESKDQEISGLTARARQLEDDLHAERQRAASQSHKLGDEAKRLGAQWLELQRELEASSKEVARLKEALKDARSANAEMDDDALSSSRQVSRLRHALEESQATLKEAQAALAQERKQCEGTQREAEAQSAKVADANRRCERLAGEVLELQGSLEQKQELIAALQAENDAWSAKLMAHREYQDKEVDALRRAAKDDVDARVSALEQQCDAQAAELRQARQEHEQALALFHHEHAAQVGQLEMQLAAAERCNAELRDLTAAMGSVRAEDVEALKGAVQELRARLKEAVREREREQRQHEDQLSALSGQLATKLAAFRAQHALAKQQAEQEMAAACADCVSKCEKRLAVLTEELQHQAATSQGQQAELAAQAARLQSAMQQLLGALHSEVSSMPAAAFKVLQRVGSIGGNDNELGGAVTTAVEEVAAAVRRNVDTAESAATHTALAALEAELLPAPAPALAAGAAPAAPRRLVSSSAKRQQRQQEASAGRAVAQPAVPTMDANDSRLGALLDRSRALLEQVVAGEAEVARLRQQVAELEATSARWAEKFSQAKDESAQAAEAARAAAVAPLHAEVQALTKRVLDLQRLHSAELGAIEAAARQQATTAQAQLRGESQRAEQLAAELSRAQDELAKHTQRAASKIEMQAQEVGLLKDQLKQMEEKMAANVHELRALRQRDREAAARSAAA